MINVIFDMDGTLLDTQKVYIDAWDYSGKLQGIPGLGNDIPNVCGMNEEGWSSYLVNKYKELDIEKFKAVVFRYVKENGSAEMKKGAKELLEFLKERNIKIALASGSDRDAVIYNLKKAGCFLYFDEIVGGDEVECGKPAPDIFLLAAKRLNAKPSDCFVFEDSKNGIISGSKAGMKCIGVPDVAPFDEESKKLMLKELPSLKEGIDVLKEYI